MRRLTIREKIPSHLHPFIAEQDPTLYTAIDHASWRYIMRVANAFFAEHAHQKYVDGLRETGISTERIPLVSEMDECLEAFGWRAVAVVGFIPPGVFTEFLSIGVLPIACDMRTAEHLSYTPAPDIVHEAAGHAPIIADQEYADYLLQYGEISRKVLISQHDLLVYECVRELSDLKEDPKTLPEKIQACQERLNRALAAVDHVSEATQLARMAWWTIEYGLVGNVKNPKIFGAGLLSSVSEGYHCLSPEVKKIPFSLECIEMSYDITRPQPQLYVARDFQELADELEKLADRMAFRTGGLEGLSRACKARTPVSVVLDSGIQIGGILVEFLSNDGLPSYLRFEGQCQLAYGDQELTGHSAKYHAKGFSTPIGKLKGLGKSLAELSEVELDRLGGGFEFESGVRVQGKRVAIMREAGRNIILTFESCTVWRGDQVLYRPEWGTFDLACGERVVSVFGGAPDRARYLADTGGYQQKPASQKTNLTPANRDLNALYLRVRELREQKSARYAELAKVHAELEAKYPDDWLLRLELLELPEFLGAPLAKTARERLAKIAKLSQDKSELIKRGLALL